MKLNKRLFGSLTKRYQLVIRNEETLAEKSVLFVSDYAKLISVGTMLFSMLVVCSLALATTILDKWLNPAHIEQENEEKIVQLASAVWINLSSKLTNKKNLLLFFRALLPVRSHLPTGQSRPMISRLGQCVRLTHRRSRWLLIRCYGVSLGIVNHLRRLSYSEPIKYLPLLFLAPSIQDIVTPPFIHRIKHYGVNIVAKEKRPR